MADCAVPMLIVGFHSGHDSNARCIDYDIFPEREFSNMLAICRCVMKLSSDSRVIYFRYWYYAFIEVCFYRS